MHESLREMGTGRHPVGAKPFSVQLGESIPPPQKKCASPSFPLTQWVQRLTLLLVKDISACFHAQGIGWCPWSASVTVSENPLCQGNFFSERLFENIFPCFPFPWNGNAIYGVSGLSFVQTFFMFLTGGTVVGEHHLEGYFWGFSANSLVLLK